MRAIHHLCFVVALTACSTKNETPPTPGNAERSATAASAAPSGGEKCEHGVAAALCSRCNPKLEAAFKAKGDWCGEHNRPESQCVICKPELANAGVK